MSRTFASTSKIHSKSKRLDGAERKLKGLKRTFTKHLKMIVWNNHLDLYSCRRGRRALC